MKVIFTCGGTAGHVNPALALAGLIKSRQPHSEILFVGAKRGMERQLVEEAGWPFKTVEVSSFHRSMKPREIKHNLVSLYNLVRSPAQARAILREFPADLVVGTGGYASFPMVKEAAKEGIPTAVHESNAIPGLTTKMLEDYAECIMVGFEECRENYKHPEKVLVTGTPVRGDFFLETKAEAKKALHMDDGRPLVLSFWGSLGAATMNRETAKFLDLESRTCPFHHVHGAGTVGSRKMAEYLGEAGVDLARTPEIQVREYIHDMGRLMRAADLVICRAGASTISELTALGVPAILVPSPNVANNHQEHNARVLGDAGGAVLLLESEATGERLFREACAILENRERQETMARAMGSLGTVDAAERIYDALMGLARNRQQK